MNKSLIWAWAIKNSIVIIAWAALAIIFNKWWIALFSILFISGLETKHKSCRVCDCCGKHGPYADSYNEALKRAKESGWLHVTEDNLDYCPDCRKEINKCDKKIGHKKDKDLEDIKSGKGLTSACVFREPWKSIVP